MDHGTGDLPGAIRVEQLFAFRIGDDFVADPRIEEVSRHDRTCCLVWSDYRQAAARRLSQFLYLEAAEAARPIPHAYRH
jgi:hypothetical protein